MRSIEAQCPEIDAIPSVHHASAREHKTLHRRTPELSLADDLGLGPPHDQLVQTAARIVYEDMSFFRWHTENRGITVQHKAPDFPPLGRNGSTFPRHQQKSQRTEHVGHCHSVLMAILSKRNQINMSSMYNATNRFECTNLKHFITIRNTRVQVLGALLRRNGKRQKRKS